MSSVLQSAAAPCACGCGEAVPISGLGDAWYDVVGAGDSRRKIFFVNQDHHKTWEHEQSQTPPE